MLISPSQSSFWKSVCFLPLLCLFILLSYIHLPPKKRYRKRTAWCDLFPAHQMLISVSVAHSVLHLSAEMGTSGANQCQLGWCNLRDGANQVANKQQEKRVGTLVLFFPLAFLLGFYVIYLCLLLYSHLKQNIRSRFL